MLGTVTWSLSFPFDSEGKNLKDLIWLYSMRLSSFFHLILSLNQSSLKLFIIFNYSFQYFYCQCFYGRPLIEYLLENIWSKFLQFRFNIRVFEKLIRICEIKHIKLQFWKNGWINPFGSYKFVNVIKILKKRKKYINRVIREPPFTPQFEFPALAFSEKWEGIVMFF